MADLTSSSTLAQIEAAYMANMYYARNGSVTEAHDFVASCRALLVKKPTQVGSREGNVEYDPEALRSEIKRAEEWITAHEPASSSARAIPTFVRGSIRNFRG